MQGKRMKVQRFPPSSRSQLDFGAADRVQVGSRFWISDLGFWTDLIAEVGPVVVPDEWDYDAASPSSSKRMGLLSSLFELRRDKMPLLKMRKRKKCGLIGNQDNRF